MDKDKIISGVLKTISGADTTRLSKFNIFNKIIGFKGVIDGVGCSTVVANIAVELAKRGVNVCVVDTAIMYPTQSLLLKANEFAKEEINDKDWFSIGATDSTSGIIKNSKYSNSIGILGFNQKHTIVDFCSTYDNEALVEVAFNIIERLYDVILVDLSNECSNISTVSAIKCHTIYQVWSDEYIAMSSIESFLQNMLISSIQSEKIRTVIINKNGDLPDDNLNELLKKYRFEKLADIPYSYEYAMKSRKGLLLHELATKDEQVNKMPDQIGRICDRILGLDAENSTISGMDIVEGKVDGTVSKKMKDRADEVNEVLQNDAKFIRDEKLRENTQEYYDKVVGAEEEDFVIEDDTDDTKKSKKRGLFSRKKG